MKLTGQSVISYRRGGRAGRPSNGCNPATGESLSLAVYSASEEEVNERIVRGVMPDGETHATDGTSMSREANLHRVHKSC